MNSTPAHHEWDLELIGQRIVTLAELSVLEHMDALGRSQADRLLKLAQDLGMGEAAGGGRDAQ